MDKETFSARVKSKERLLYCVARTMLPPCDCEDAVQNAVLCAWIHLPALRDENAFEPWLIRILRNECLTLLRRKKREQNAATLYADSSDYQPIGLSDAMNALLPQERLLLLLHHDEGYAVAELAAVYRTTQSIIKMRLYRARKHLQKLLNEKE